MLLQLIFGFLLPEQGKANIATAAVNNAIVAQSITLLNDYRTAYLIGIGAVDMMVTQLWGTLVGVISSVAVYYMVMEENTDGTISLGMLLLMPTLTFCVLSFFFLRQLLVQNIYWQCPTTDWERRKLEVHNNITYYIMHTRFFFVRLEKHSNLSHTYLLFQRSYSPFYTGLFRERGVGKFGSRRKSSLGRTLRRIRFSSYLG